MQVDRVIFENDGISETKVICENGYTTILEETNGEHKVSFNDGVNKTLVSTTKGLQLTLEQANNYFTVIAPVCSIQNITLTVDSDDEERLFTAVGNIDKYDCVSIVGDLTVQKTNINESEYSKYVGVALETVTSGSAVRVKLTGPIYEPTWNWDTSLELWCGINSELTQTAVNGSGLIDIQVADVISRNLIVVSRFKQILL